MYCTDILAAPAQLIHGGCEDADDWGPKLRTAPLRLPRKSSASSYSIRDICNPGPPVPGSPSIRRSHLCQNGHFYPTLPVRLKPRSKHILRPPKPGSSTHTHILLWSSRQRPDAKPIRKLHPNPPGPLIPLHRPMDPRQRRRTGPALLSELTTITLELLDSLNVDRFSIASHSTGVYQQLHLAQRAPGRVV